MTDSKKQNPAVQAAKERKPSADGVLELSTGYRAKLVPVAASLYAEVAARVPDPEVPMWANPDKEGRQEPNPGDPAYLRELAAAERKRAEAVMDAMLLFGVELEGGVPEDGTWLQRLEYMVKLGHLDLSEFELDNPIDREFVFKRYVAVSAADLTEIMKRSGVTQEAIAKAASNFPGDEARGAH